MLLCKFSSRLTAPSNLFLIYINLFVHVEGSDFIGDRSADNTRRPGTIPGELVRTYHKSLSIIRRQYSFYNDIRNEFDVYPNYDIIRKKLKKLLISDKNGPLYDTYQKVLRGRFVQKRYKKSDIISTKFRKKKPSTFAVKRRKIKKKKNM